VPETRNRRRTASGNAASNQIVVGEGVVGRLVDRACDNPAMTGGLFVMALTATAVISNALFLQNVRHPEPLFATRPPLVVDRNAPLSPPLPPRRDDQTGSIPPPLPRPAPIAPMTTKSDADTLTRDIQKALAQKGMYLGAIDGEYGPLSRSAITAYQTAQGLNVTGEPSVALLEHLRMSSAAAPPPRAEATGAPQSETPALPAVDITVADSQRLRYERVQAALNRIGYGPVAVDGAANEETVNAIRRFELDNGLPISGSADDAVIDRLIAIGALPAT
jgi:peptidoglycan hydrolase-like protein with peptidoglycan-binding domain